MILPKAGGTHSRHDGRHSSFEKERLGRRKFPIAVRVSQRKGGEMPDDAGHHDMTMAPRMPKVEIEAVILDEGVSGDA